MKSLVLNGYKDGFNTIEATLAIKRILGKGLADSKSDIETVCQLKTVTYIDEDVKVDALERALSALGVGCSSSPAPLTK